MWGTNLDKIYYQYYFSGLFKFQFIIVKILEPFDTFAKVFWTCGKVLSFFFRLI